MKCILHGVGRLILKDYTDKTKVIAHSDLQQFTLESTYSADDITGGNKLFPIASFKKDQALNCTAKDATFNDGIIKYLDGGDVKTGAVTLTDFLEVTIPDDGVVDLGVTPSNVSIDGFTKTDSEVTKGNFKLDTTKVTFASQDAGQTVTIVYDYQSGADAKQTSITQKSMAKPFEAVYIFDIYDEDTQIVAKGTITIFKAQCTSGLKLDMQHQTAFAPEFSFSARDAKRADKKLWDFTVEEVKKK